MRILVVGYLRIRAPRSSARASERARLGHPRLPVQLRRAVYRAARRDRLRTRRDRRRASSTRAFVPYSSPARATSPTANASTCSRSCSVSSARPCSIRSSSSRRRIMAYDARALYGDRTPWIASNWGHCISYFGRDLNHVERIKAVLRSCDFYTSECHRDLGLARAFGFGGRALPVVPIAGHFDLPAIARLRQPGVSSERRTDRDQGVRARVWAGVHCAGRAREMWRPPRRLPARALRRDGACRGTRDAGLRRTSGSSSSSCRGSIGRSCTTTS